jgi:hypothetical protein
MLLSNKKFRRRCQDRFECPLYLLESVAYSYLIFKLTHHSLLCGCGSTVPAAATIAEITTQERDMPTAKSMLSSSNFPTTSASARPISSVREPDRRRRDERRPFPLRTKNCHHNPKQPLDRKSPIQVRIHSPPAKCQANSAKLKNARGHARKANKQFELLGTTMIVNAMHRQAHLFAIKPEHAGENPNAFSARTRRIAGIGAKLLTRRETLAGDQTTARRPEQLSAARLSRRH